MDQESAPREVMCSPAQGPPKHIENQDVASLDMNSRSFLLWWAIVFLSPFLALPALMLMYFFVPKVFLICGVCVCVCVCVCVSKRDSLVMCSSEKVNEKVSFCIPLLYRSSQKSFQNNALHPNTSRGIFISPCFLDHLPGLGFSQRTWGDVIFQQTISSSCFPSMILGSITCKAYNHHMPDYF